MLPRFSLELRKKGLNGIDSVLEFEPGCADWLLEGSEWLLALGDANVELFKFLCSDTM